MRRDRYPPGDTTASRVKALVIWLESTHGRAAADALMREIEVDADYLSDETRPLSIAMWHKALEKFASRFGRETIRQTWAGVVDPENLGVWTRVLRGTVGPEGALRQLDALGGEEARTVKWETVHAAPGVFRGRAVLLHDPMLERNGLFALARAAELMSVPVLFGYRPGTVRMPRANAAPPVASRSGGIVEEYEVTWDVPSLRRAIYAAAGSAVLGALAVKGTGVPTVAAATAGGYAAAAGGALAAGWELSRQRKAESHTQMTRIRALERSVTLKEQRDRASVGFFEGSVIGGRYRLGRKLGAGASGVIHQATRLADNLPVAIKLLRTAVAHDTVASDRLRREAEALGLTWHSNVVEVFEHDHLPDGTAYLVMEHLLGESLATRLKRLSRLSPRDLLPIALQVCDALGAVHAAGVIHRDVKPSNIFLAMIGKPGAPEASRVERIKLLDFGIARVEWAETRLTNMGAPLGTPGYMSPEQEQGGEIDPRTDLFGLGAVLYECLTGSTPPSLVSGVFSAAAPAPVEAGLAERDATGTLPAAWRRIIERAMAPLARERYADARAMKDALAELETEAEVGAASSSSAAPLTT